MNPSLKEALELLQHAADGFGDILLDSTCASALLLDREALWTAAKQLKASERNLLEVCEALFDWCQRTDSPPDVMVQARAVIAKARGPR